MTKVFSRWLPCVTLAAWAAILLHFYLSGRLQAFLHPMFRPYVLIAGVAMVIMAVLFAVFPADANCCGTDEECGHPLSRYNAGKLFTFLVLLLPITTAAFFSQDSFGKTAIMNRGVIMDATALRPPSSSPTSEAPAFNTTAPDLPLPSSDPATAATAAQDESTPPEPGAATKDYLQRNTDGTIVAEILDLLYAAQDAALRKDFDGKPVQLIAQMMPDATQNPNGNRFKAVRMFMTCCAADARPVATLVEAPGTLEIPEMSWVKIIGTATFPIENGKRTAVLKATQVEKTEPPEETMLY